MRIPITMDSCVKDPLIPLRSNDDISAMYSGTTDVLKPLANPAKSRPKYKAVELVPK
jgi:hypothetical protein